MANTISINTPQGIKRVRIAGDSLTEEDLKKIKKAFPQEKVEGQLVFDPDLYRPLSKEEAQRFQAEEKEKVEAEEPVVEDIPDKEIENSWLRFQLGRMDDDEERLNFLNIKLGEGATERVAEDTFVVDQAKVHPEIRKKYGLEDTGKIYVDKPGFSWYDIADFGGESGPSLIGAVGASLMATPFTLPVGMLFVLGGAGGFKAIDEGVEYLQGLNRQSAGEVASAIAIDAIANAAFEGGGRLILKVAGRFLKGGGPEVSAQRVDEIVASGISKSKATRIAKEESMARYRGLVAAGARPTIQAATGKSLSARALAINEKIWPNPKVARENVSFVAKIIDDMNAGRLTKEDAEKIISSEAESLSRLVTRQLADPEKAYKTVQFHLKEVIKTELDAFERAFVPSQGMPNLYIEGAALSARLFQAESKALYDLAKKQIGPQRFDITPIRDTISKLRKENKFVEYKGRLFDLLKKSENDTMTLPDLQQLKQALRLSAKDPDLIATQGQYGVSRIIESVDDVLDAQFVKLSQDLARGFKVVEVPKGTQIPSPVSIKTALGAVDQPTMVTTSVTYKAVPLAPGEKESLRQGLGLWKQANQAYSQGQEMFNNSAINVIIKQARGKHFNSNVEVVDLAVKPGNPEKLRMYLNAVTPKGAVITKLTEPGSRQTLQRVKTLVGENNFKEANELLENTGLVNAVPKINEWMTNLPRDDIFRAIHLKEYNKELDAFIQLSGAGTNSNKQLLRNSIRNGLATEWITQARVRSLDNFGEPSPSGFANAFKQLEKETQDLLFGADNASAMRNVVDDFYLLGKDQATVLEKLPGVRNQFLKTQIQTLKEAVEGSVDESRYAVLNAIRSGEISENPGKLIPALLQDPKSYRRLASVVGDAELEKVGGLKDMVMTNLLSNVPLDNATMQSGKWGRSLLSTIEAQNKNGALTNILGSDTVKALRALADDAIAISDVPIKGFGGIAAAPAAMALIAMLASGQWIHAAGTAGTVIIFSRLLRNKGVLKLLTSTRMRGDEYKKAIQAGADLPSVATQKQAGSTSYALNRMIPIVMQEANIVLGSGIVGVGPAEEEKRIAAETREFLADQQVPRSPRRGATGDPRDIPLKTILPPKGYRDSAAILRKVEEEKLLGQ